MFQHKLDKWIKKHEKVIENPFEYLEIIDWNFKGGKYSIFNTYLSLFSHSSYLKTPFSSSKSTNAESVSFNNSISSFNPVIFFFFCHFISPP